ncbi:MAG: hypothetical protein ACI915_001832 [Gammaproteobacteria bacterium]|jgi:hypothetical protein
MKVVLISPYEIGRQPFGLAEPAAMLRSRGYDVCTIDLSRERIDPIEVRDAGLIALYLAMHTATRIAFEALPRLSSLAPGVHLCAYGLYAPMNEALLRRHGVNSILGGEFEPSLIELADSLRTGRSIENPLPQNGRVDFVVPDRTTMVDLDRYAQLILADGTRKVMGFAEASRGCKHLCRHCPIVPIYNGKFRAIPVPVVIADIENQIRMGAEHISFGDPDFLNGPTHARKVVEALHQRFPRVTFDATIKIEHLLAHSGMLPLLRDAGCLFITSAAESVDDTILDYLQKNHTNEDFGKAVEILREIGIDLAPTFVAFNPWTTIQGYIDLLSRLVDLRMVESVPSIQLAIRLLVPKGSYLLNIPGFVSQLEEFDPEILGYPWLNRDKRVDDLQASVQLLVEKTEGSTRRSVFNLVWRIAHEFAGTIARELPDDLGSEIPHHSEAWYCCAEPTNQQLVGF